MAGEKQRLDRTSCEYIVRAFLAGQGWSLADPAEMASAILQALPGEEPTGKEAIQKAVWARYASLLHEHCRRTASEQHDVAWSELRAWLVRQAPMVNDDPRDQDEIVQETLIELQKKLEASPMRTPRALWAYALATLKRKDVDLHRRRTAVKRGEGEIGSLESLVEAYQEEDGPETWEERLQEAGQHPWGRSTEGAVVNREVREELMALFRRLFSSQLQLWVAEAHFLDGLRPAEIAGLAGKTPHEIRMVKARVVRKLRKLPAGDRQRLLEILDRT